MLSAARERSAHAHELHEAALVTQAQARVTEVLQASDPGGVSRAQRELLSVAGLHHELAAERAGGPAYDDRTITNAHREIHVGVLARRRGSHALRTLQPASRGGGGQRLETKISLRAAAPSSSATSTRLPGR